MPSMLAAGLFVAPVLNWLIEVNRHVDEPYLDEVFHVRQAQHYCDGEFHIWDPKITTPPGLYLISTALGKIPFLGCELTSLRWHVLMCLAVLAIVLFAISRDRLAAKEEAQIRDTDANGHSMFNILMFPPLFFFAALYYTDVPSTLSVLIFHWYFVHSHANDTPVLIRSSVLVLLGVASLMFRQTNIFWVAVFPAGIVLVHKADQGLDVVKQSMYRGSGGFGDSLVSIAKTSWKMQALYDPSVGNAPVDDYVKTVVSLTVCLLSGATRPKYVVAVTIALAPYLVLLVAFAAFVFWNDGVVLGDKSNHIATLHLPQMLYIWPYFAFFSWPMIYPHLLVLPISVLSKLPPLSNLDGPMLMFKRRHILPRLWLFAIATFIAILAVHFNTIVHPFTLADNRHYTFYVFRLLMRHWTVKYAVVPIYVLAGWACIQALGDPSGEPHTSRARENTTEQGQSDSRQTHPTKATSTIPHFRKLSLPDGHRGATITFVLVWLATSSLQLITAPLVEPRYFILPWLYWRIHLPLRQAEHTTSSPRSFVSKYWHGYDHRLWLETTWILVVRMITSYIFIRWTFEWKQEPGKTQRFMW